MISFYLNFATIVIVTVVSPPLKGQYYLDPGSGSILIQVLIASLLGALFILRSSWGKIKTFLGKFFSKDQDDQE